MVLISKCFFQQKQQVEDQNAVMFDEEEEEVRSCCLTKLRNEDVIEALNLLTSNPIDPFGIWITKWMEDGFGGSSRAGKLIIACT